jgi:hypothetical protein
MASTCSFVGAPAALRAPHAASRSKAAARAAPATRAELNRSTDANNSVGLDVDAGVVTLSTAFGRRAAFAAAVAATLTASAGPASAASQRVLEVGLYKSNAVEP